MANRLYEQTTTALLDGLSDPSNEQVWYEFDQRYRSVLIGFGRRLGLTEADAHDAAQDTLVKFVRSYRAGKYDRDRGRLRAWIIGIARHCIRDIQAAQAGHPAQRGMSAVEQFPGGDELEDAWETECRKAVLERSLGRLRRETAFDERTVRAFEEVVLRERQPAEVADELGVSRNEVYLAKHRCLTRLRGLVATITATYQADEGGLP